MPGLSEFSSSLLGFLLRIVAHQDMALVNVWLIKSVGPCLDTGDDFWHKVFEHLCVRVLLKHNFFVWACKVFGFSKTVPSSASLGHFLTNSACLSCPIRIWELWRVLLTTFNDTTNRAGCFPVACRSAEFSGDSYKFLTVGPCTLPFFGHRIRLRLVNCLVGVPDRVDISLADMIVILLLLLHQVLLFEVLQLLLRRKDVLLILVE